MATTNSETTKTAINGTQGKKTRGPRAPRVKTFGETLGGLIDQLSAMTPSERDDALRLLASAFPAAQPSGPTYGA